jgi:hypothetical protein
MDHISCEKKILAAKIRREIPIRKNSTNLSSEVKNELGLAIPKHIPHGSRVKQIVVLAPGGVNQAVLRAQNGHQVCSEKSGSTCYENATVIIH